MPGRFQACLNASEHSESQVVPGRSSGASRSTALQGASGHVVSVHVQGVPAYCRACARACTCPCPCALACARAQVTRAYSATRACENA
eukprot:2256812-Alexandrium_andersonii.AAC.1